jgi:predicted  nucleic acid-binding Zn-ribbon protein
MRTASCAALAGLAFALGLSGAAAQDVRGLEICTAEKNMERRTGCLQANIDFLQQRLNKITIDAQQKQTALERELAAAKAQAASAQAEIAALKEALGKLRGQVEDLQKAKGENKK